MGLRESAGESFCDRAKLMCLLLPAWTDHVLLEARPWPLWHPTWPLGRTVCDVDGRGGGH